jgi:two-component system response regulator DctR
MAKIKEKDVIDLTDNSTSKIIVIDDETDILYTIKEICSIGGWDAITVSSGSQGYELCRIHHPDLVIVDYHMAGWDGLTTVKKIRQLDEAVSILVLTVDETQEVAERFMAAGATDFAIKPIKAPDLISRIKINLKIHGIQQKYIKEEKNVIIDKGMSPATLSIICEYLKQQTEGLTIEEITSGINLAYQTVHRYVQYLLEEKRIEVVPIYGQLGRPKNKYRLIK